VDDEPARPKRPPQPADAEQQPRKRQLVKLADRPVPTPKEGPTGFTKDCGEDAQLGPWSSLCSCFLTIAPSLSGCFAPLDESPDGSSLR
jgi:hypothetical protein